MLGEDFCGWKQKSAVKNVKCVRTFFVFFYLNTRSLLQLLLRRWVIYDRTFRCCGNTRTQHFDYTFKHPINYSANIGAYEGIWNNKIDVPFWRSWNVISVRVSKMMMRRKWRCDCEPQQLEELFRNLPFVTVYSGIRKMLAFLLTHQNKVTLNFGES